MSKPKLLLTSQALDRLHEAVDKVRKGSTTVKVAKDDAWHLLLDYATLQTIHKGKFEENGE